MKKKRSFLSPIVSTFESDKNKGFFTFSENINRMENLDKFLMNENLIWKHNKFIDTCGYKFAKVNK